MMNIWRRGSLTKNPYLRNAFRVARVPREIARYKTLVHLIGQTRRIVSTDKEAHTIQGEPVSDAEINVAEQILLDPRQRIREEILVHNTEKLPLDALRKMLPALGQAVNREDPYRLPAANLQGLDPWVTSLVRQFLDEQPGGDPSFGSLELGLVPPFGRERYNSHG